MGAVYVLGDFEVVQRGDRWTIVPAARYGPLRNWQALGAPFYPWEMKYAKRFKVNGVAGKSYYVKADRWTGSLVEYGSTAVKAGIVFAEPYTLDVTPFVRKGKNDVELRVVGNMENLIGPHHVAYDGIVDPNRWNVPQLRKGVGIFPDAVRVAGGFCARRMRMIIFENE